MSDRAFYLEMAKELLIAELIDKDTFYYVAQHGRFPLYENSDGSDEPETKRSAKVSLCEMINDTRKHLFELCYHIDRVEKRVEKLEYANRPQPESPAKIVEKLIPDKPVPVNDIYYTPTTTDLGERVANNFPGQFLGIVKGDSKEMDRCARGEAAKFILWAEHSGSNSWIANLRKIVGGRKFWLRRCSFKNLVEPGEVSDTPLFIVIRLLYEG